MKRLRLLVLLVLLTGCAPLDPVVVDEQMVRYCNDPLLEEGEPCITDDRATLLGVMIGSIVFLSSVSGLGYYYFNKKRDS
jgi:hypothetical protein